MVILLNLFIYVLSLVVVTSIRVVTYYYGYHFIMFMNASSECLVAVTHAYTLIIIICVTANYLLFHFTCGGNPHRPDIPTVGGNM